MARVTMEFKQTLINEVLDGESMSDVAKKYDVKRPTLYSWVKRIGPTLKKETAKPVAKDNARLKEFEEILKEKISLIELVNLLKFKKSVETFVEANNNN